MSLEDLLSQEVTTASKKARPIGDSASAIYVINQDNIRRSAARTLTDLLRQVPGLEVFDLSSSGTSVSARGFSSRFASNLLVMVDGAAIYSTSISGMFWDQALMPLQDIERIEVIRGPGGALWGSNSINGVINVITKQSVDTQGLRASGLAGLRDARAELGYGTRLSDELGVRAYGTYRRSQGMKFSDGSNDHASWEGGLGGVRFDYAPTSKDSVVFLSEYSRGGFTQPYKGFAVGPTGVTFPISYVDNDFSSTHILSRWSHTASQSLTLAGQVYFNQLKREELGVLVARDLYDASFEGHWQAGARHEIGFGISGRISRDRIGGNNLFTLMKNNSNVDRIATGYLEDEFSLIPDRLRITLGSKFEHNNFSGSNIQPNARIFYRANDKLSMWAAISRAVRTPLLQERGVKATLETPFPLPGSGTLVPAISTVIGNPESKPEVLDSIEAGLWSSLGRGWIFDVAAFYNRYDDLASINLSSISPLFLAGFPFPVGLQTTAAFGNEAKGRSWGTEILLSGNLAPNWSMEASYSYLDLKIRPKTGFENMASPVITGGLSSHHQLRLKTAVDLDDRFEVSGALHYVSRSLDGLRPAYTDLGLRAEFQATPNIQIALSGSNLLKNKRLEYYQLNIPFPPNYVVRTGQLEIRTRF
ncbi:TonB-dependent receptor [Sphingobium sp. DEHP117]|uniref:TonB-dependent receptor plug domain-containing protein n=1 Tax=Sphingobium sp. DEHP117 TaxID=2993436 RepID=UPI0027D4A6AB|nr:TonB-dependent receptor [Sphingobium sp. DEHP117]MDQ4421004.1 TonB-dependent receptor [Sphingobium sp. DEHP117]